jgi:hypothetical protein
MGYLKKKNYRMGMRNCFGFSAAGVLLSGAFLAGCAGLGAVKDGDSQPLEDYDGKVSAVAEEQYHEDAALLEDLPAGIRGYLLKLAAAFAAHDAAFLLEQGESGYEAAVRGSVSDSEYLAMLYRAGAYADNAEWQAAYTLNLDKIVYIDYTSWREYGPVLEVDGKVYIEGLRPLSFSMKVLWRLAQPKLLGVYP